MLTYIDDGFSSYLLFVVRCFIKTILILILLVVLVWYLFLSALWLQKMEENSDETEPIKIHNGCYFISGTRQKIKFVLGTDRLISWQHLFHLLITKRQSIRRMEFLLILKYLLSMSYPVSFRYTLTNMVASSLPIPYDSILIHLWLFCSFIMTRLQSLS